VSVSTDRRLRELRELRGESVGRALAAGGVLVDFRLTIPESTSAPSTVTAALISEAGAQFSAKINERISDEGLAYVVQGLAVGEVTIVVLVVTTPAAPTIQVRAVGEGSGFEEEIRDGSISFAIAFGFFGLIGCMALTYWHMSRKRMKQVPYESEYSDNKPPPRSPSKALDQDEVHEVIAGEVQCQSSRMSLKSPLPSTQALRVESFDGADSEPSPQSRDTVKENMFSLSSLALEEEEEKEAAAQGRTRSPRPGYIPDLEKENLKEGSSDSNDAGHVNTATSSSWAKASNQSGRSNASFLN